MSLRIFPRHAALVVLVELSLRHEELLPRIFVSASAHQFPTGALRVLTCAIDVEAAHWLVTLASAMGWQMALLQSLLQRIATERRMSREQHHQEWRMSVVAVPQSRARDAKDESLLDEWHGNP